MASTRASTDDQHEPTSSELDKNQKRKLRNRLSQRAFRRRQAEYLRDLRNRAEASQKPDNERVAELEEENGRLRAHITELQSRLEGVQVTLQMIASSSSKILGRSGSSLPRQPRIEERDSEQEENEPSRDESITADKAQSDSTPWPPFSSAALEAIQIPDLSFPTDVDSTIEIPISDAVQARSNLIRDVMGSVGPIDPNLSKSPLQLQRIPNIWNFNYQMGNQAYIDAIESCASSRPTSGLRWVDSNSPISDHIQILKRLLLTKLKPTILDNRSCQTLYQSVSTVLAMFNSVTRPDVMNWYAKTRFFHIIELTAWQILPCSLTYSRVHERYRPTELQLGLQGQYPCVVDWIPFASIRDRIIQLHAANPCVDQIFCDTVSAYVVESTLSELVVGGSLMKVYIRVTDLIASMALQQGEGEGIDSMASLPAPDIKTLFSSPEYAYLAFKHLKMDCGASYYKIDPVFFSKYPELCDPSDDIVASGVPLKPGTQTTLTSPNYVDAMTVATYCSFINFSFDAATALSRLEYV
ncbi:hypothetical protein NW754_013763 [Fusarium falciforme]|uniref:BZIP domain-containing protein n=1 Tax=Fusarium falciforme TaxID=195108 RepID=A0A9W8RA17_9HYPO|nr:hypothetical protein NW754_013763 [Fusarium falciforme]KAJ4189202.1 hypothetical protein NW755_006021 [Fusarium falciforme]